MPPLKSPDPLAARFGAVVGRMRYERHWSVLVLAQKVGYQPAHVSRIEHGRNVPSLHTIVRFAEVFGVKPSSMIAEMEQSLESP